MSKSENASGPWEILVIGPPEEHGAAQRLAMDLEHYLWKKHPEVYENLNTSLGDTERHFGQGRGARPTYNLMKAP